MIPMNKPEMLVSTAHQKFDAEGRLTDEDTRKKLRDFLSAFATFARRWRGN
jgi:chromate reductase